MPMPRISIVTPSYQQRCFIEQTLLSVSCQEYENLEHLVIDGLSTDGTQQILTEYARSYNLQWASEKDSGQTEAINKGLRLATGDIIGWVNSDDTYLPGTFKKVAEYFDAHPSVDWVYGDAYWIDAHGYVTGLYKALPFSLETLVYEGMFLPQPTVFIRKKLLASVGALDESIHTAMDYDFCLRLGVAGRAAYIPDILATRRAHPDTKSAKNRSMFYRDQLACLDRLFQSDMLPVRILQMKEVAYSNAHRVGGYRLFMDGNYELAERALLRALRGRNRFGAYELASIFLLLLECRLQIRWVMPGLSKRRRDMQLARSYNGLNVSWKDPASRPNVQ